MATIEIENVGPIERLAVSVPPDGGVVVLRGENGSGKSTALSAAEALTGRTAKLTTRDGSRGTGRIDGLGATVVLGRRITRAGEVEVASLEGRISIADLVQPPIKGDAEADRVRIRALVSLTGVEPTPEMFRELVGPAVDEVEVDWAGDVVEVAGRLKRALEARARSVEAEASVRDGQAKALEESARDVDMSAPSDEASLRAEHSEAVAALAMLRERSRAHDAASERISQATARLETLRSGYGGPSVAEARRAQEQAAHVHKDAEAEVEDLRRRLAEAEGQARLAEQRHSAAVAALKAAIQHERSIAEHERALTESCPEPVDPRAMDVAQGRVERAAEAVERGAVIRRARAASERATAVREEAAGLSARAAELRAAAGAIDDCLSRAITTKNLYVRDGRLYAAGHRRGDVLYGELSEGERWSLAFDAVAPVVGDHGLIVLPQGAWEGLDPANRRHVAELARQHRLVVLTAESAEGGLRSEEYHDAR